MRVIINTKLNFKEETYGFDFYKMADGHECLDIKIYFHDNRDFLRIQVEDYFFKLKFLITETRPWFYNFLIQRLVLLISYTNSVIKYKCQELSNVIKNVLKASMSGASYYIILFLQYKFKSKLFCLNDSSELKYGVSCYVFNENTN